MTVKVMTNRPGLANQLKGPKSSKPRRKVTAPFIQPMYQPKSARSKNCILIIRGTPLGP